MFWVLFVVVVVVVMRRVVVLSVLGCGSETWAFWEYFESVGS